MNKIQQSRLWRIVILLCLLALGLSLVLYALKQNINLYYTPKQLLEKTIAPGHQVRLGGYVKKHSVKFSEDGTKISFLVTDGDETIAVVYHGILPSLFREGQGVVATGKLDHQRVFHATEILAKHDENYTPPILDQKTRLKYDASGNR